MRVLRVPLLLPCPVATSRIDVVREVQLLLQFLHPLDIPDEVLLQGLALVNLSIQQICQLHCHCLSTCQSFFEVIESRQEGGCILVELVVTNLLHETTPYATGYGETTATAIIICTAKIPAMIITGTNAKLFILFITFPLMPDRIRNEPSHLNLPSPESSRLRGGIPKRSSLPELPRRPFRYRLDLLLFGLTRS